MDHTIFFTHYCYICIKIVIAERELAFKMSLSTDSSENLALLSFFIIFCVLNSTEERYNVKFASHIAAKVSSLIDKL